MTAFLYAVLAYAVLHCARFVVAVRNDKFPRRRRREGHQDRPGIY